MRRVLIILALLTIAFVFPASSDSSMDRTKFTASAQSMSFTNTSIFEINFDQLNSGNYAIQISRIDDGRLLQLYVTWDKIKQTGFLTSGKNTAILQSVNWHGSQCAVALQRSITGKLSIQTLSN